MADKSPRLNDADFEKLTEHIEGLLQKFEDLPLPKVREDIFELLNCLDFLHREALTWLEDLHRDPDRPFPSTPGEDSVRLFNSLELSRLDAECRGYLMYLEHMGILSALNREIVIDRLMALGAGEIDVEQVKWVTLMVLFSQAEQGNAFNRMEDLVFEENTGLIN